MWTSVKCSVYEKLSENKLSELLRSADECGGTDVDDSFENFWEEIVGAVVLSSFKDRFKEDCVALFRGFEVKKRRYNKEFATFFRIPATFFDHVIGITGESVNDCVKSSRFKNIRICGNKLKIDSQVNIVTDIIFHVKTLLENRTASDCSAILMVGGFSESNVLQESIQKKFSGLKVIIPDEAGLAVLKGAVILGHNPLTLDIERTGETSRPAGPAPNKLKINKSLTETVRPRKLVIRTDDSITEYTLVSFKKEYRPYRKEMPNEIIPATVDGVQRQQCRTIPVNLIEEDEFILGSEEYEPYNGHSIQATYATLPSYKMNRRPRGWCIILNIETGVNQPAREGTQYDKARLKEVFQDKLHFLVQCHDNPTSTKMTRSLVEISHNNDHAAFDCFVCCILSHGDLGHVFGSDGRAVPIKDLTSVFNAYRCPSLGGKPKLFFIQACQGNTLMTGVTVATDIQKDACREETIPLEADFLFGYATVPGYVSYRGTQSGSWYMRALCNALTEYHDRYHLLEILTAVNSMVAQESDEVRGGVYKQIPAPQSTLTKLLYFK